MERIGPEAFDGQRLRRPGVWIVGFLADWCPFCRAFAPRLEALAKAGRSVAVADLTDEESPLWERFGVDVVPTILVFRDGSVVFRRDGRLGRGLDAPDLEAAERAMATS